MDAFVLNGAVVNGAGSLASIVYLPSSTATVQLALNERIAVSMEGNVGISIDQAGDISKVINLGDAPTDISIVFTGDLTKYQIVTFGATTFGLGFDMSGTAATLKLGPSGVAGFGLETVGSLTRIGTFSGDASYGLATTGTMHSLRNLGNQTTSYAIETTGSLLRTGYMAGEVTFSIAPTAELSQGLRSYMDGTVAIDFIPTGRIAMRGGLSGNSLTGLSLTGDLSIGKRIPLPSASTTLVTDFTGLLTANYRLQGLVTLETEMTGVIRNRVYLVGSTTLTTAITGGLANNAMGPDLDSVLMVRPESQREMTR